MSSKFTKKQAGYEILPENKIVGLAIDAMTVEIV